MLSSSTYALLRIAGWTYLPDLITQTLLHLLHTLHHHLLSHPLPFPLPSLFLPLLPKHPPPPKHTTRYATHHRLTFSLVILLFLLYNLLEAARSMPPNFYQILGVGQGGQGVDEAGLKVAFRAFAKRNHPDRPEVGRGGEELFIEVRDAFEALKDPVVRFAYDRFGPDVLTWTQCTTTREYLRHGLMQSSGYHIVTGAGLLFFSAIGKPSPVAFWRYLLFAALFASELSLLLSPSTSPSPPYLPSHTSTSSIHPPPQHSTILTTLFPHLVAYQHILLLHQLFMFLSIALSRVAPALLPIVRESVGLGSGAGEREREMDWSGFVSVVDRFGGLIRAADRELYLMLHTELHSVQPQPHTKPQRGGGLKPVLEPSPSVMATFTREMQNMIIENKLRKEAPLRSIWEAAVERGLIRERERAVSMSGNGTAGGGEGLPSPVSPVQKLGELSSAGGPSPGLGLGLGSGGGSQGRLPSPRPSPPPPPGIVRRGSSYLRARSVSY